MFFDVSIDCFPCSFLFVSGEKSKKPIIIGIVTSVAFLVAGLVLVILYRRNRSQQNLIEGPQVVNTSLSAKDIASLQKNQYRRKESIEGLNRLLTHLWICFTCTSGTHPAITGISGTILKLG